ncbi:MAG: histidinol dehydrogenase [Deltaproteobacteria bacterium]|nr:histidinol dehydrogenase [Deltaproteobacteria bacterium]
MMRTLESKNKGFERELLAILTRRGAETAGVEEAVREIIEGVRAKGDEALIHYTRQFDGVDIALGELEIPREEWRRAQKTMEKETLSALQRAAERIESFHRRQLRPSWFDTEGGVVRGQVVRPMDRAGVYVPGGKAAYPSSLLMNVIPAKVAGVREVVVLTPPSPDGINPSVLAAAHLVGADRVLRVGGAQAVAALAYGTQSVPRADIIVGPGNAYVTAAKRLLYGVVMVDMVAGPSEILVLADGSTPPAFVAADLLSQAEHDEQAWPILITPSAAFAQQVAEEVGKMMETLPRREIIRACLECRGLIIVVRDVAEGVGIANRIAPEHLELALKDPLRWLGEVENAGAVFLGPYTPEAVGDYLGGPNHVLPTGGTARFFSPLGVEHFLKRTNILSFSQDALDEVREDVARLARLEGFEAHARSVEVRRKEDGSDGTKGKG